MLYWLLIILVILFIFFYIRPVNEELFANQYVMPQEDKNVVYTSPDLDWKDFEEKVQSQMKPDKKETKTTGDDESEGEKETEEYKTNTDDDKPDQSSEQSTSSFLFGWFDKKDSDDEHEDEKDSTTSTPKFTSDQLYILQRQKSAPRYLPKFSKNSIHVYVPKKPKLDYATRPGPNSFHDSLTEREHVQTEKELRNEWQAQKMAQERHNDLLRRQNWVFQSVNDITPDYILKQPKMVPGPSNGWKYNRYTHYGKAQI